VTAKKPKSKSGSAAELAELYPAPKVLKVRVRSAPDATTFDDAEITVDEMDIVQIGQAANALSAIPNITTGNLLAIAALHQAEVFAALGIAIRWPAERVALLAAGSFADVLTEVYRANDGFFIRLLALLGYVDQGTPRRPANGDGAAPLPTSASMAESSAPRH